MPSGKVFNFLKFYADCVSLCHNVKAVKSMVHQIIIRNSQSPRIDNESCHEEMMGILPKDIQPPNSKNESIDTVCLLGASCHQLCDSKWLIKHILWSLIGQPSCQPTRISTQNIPCRLRHESPHDHIQCHSGQSSISFSTNTNLSNGVYLTCVAWIML